MFESLGRHRIFLTAAVLLGAAALLLSSSLQRRTRYSFLDRLLFDLAVPIEKMVALPAQSARSVWYDYLDLVGVRRENRNLRQQLSELSEENRQFREALLAGERYRRMDALRDKFHQPMLPASLIGVDSSSWFRTVLLDKGTREGVRRGMAVVTPDGVVGHVVAVSSRASKVLLVIDRSSAVDVMVERSRVRGIVQGLASDRCELKYVTRGEDVKPGDQLISSGMDGIFPKGLAVGRVARVDPTRRGLFQRADVEPAVDFKKLEEVFVILELSPQQKLLQEQAQRLG
jgi:rod shape-determining protein MreC